jgi:hypothetical protein
VLESHICAAPLLNAAQLRALWMRFRSEKSVRHQSLRSVLQRQKCDVVTDHAALMAPAHRTAHRERSFQTAVRAFSFSWFQQQMATALCRCLVAGCIASVNPERLEPSLNLVNQVPCCIHRLCSYHLSFSVPLSFARLQFQVSMSTCFDVRM